MMAIHICHKLGIVLALGLTCLALSACGPRVIISTGTTIGLKATPGDGNTRPPQVTFAYKRAELALVPTSNAKKATTNSDAFSTLAAIHFSTQWFGNTEIRSFLGTGLAARDIQGVEKTQAPEKNQSGIQEIQGAEAVKKSPFWTSFACGRQGIKPESCAAGKSDTPQ